MSSKVRKVVKGFSLIELMIVVAIVAIIASFALPSYFDSVERSRRAEGKALLLDFASRQERYYTANSRYATVVTNASPPAPPASTTMYNVDVNGENGFYTVTTTGGTTYRLTARPSWTERLVCGDLILTNTGVRSTLGDADGDSIVNTQANLTLDQDDIDLCWR